MISKVRGLVAKVSHPKRWMVTCSYCGQWTTTKTRKVAKDRLYFHQRKGCPEPGIVGMWHLPEKPVKHYASDSYNEGYKGSC